ncbi:Kinesin-like protein kif20a, variant 2 [Balamuthia mandrillaris]
MSETPPPHSPTTGACRSSVSKGNIVPRNIFGGSPLRSKAKKEPLEVYLRIRPLLSEELEQGWKDCTEILDQKTVILRDEANARNTEDTTYTFTKVLPSSVDQSSLFQETGVPLMKDFLSGKNCLLFAYGRTNSGKTFTTHGTAENPGIVPRMLKSLFNSLDKVGGAAPSAASRANKAASTGDSSAAFESLEDMPHMEVASDYTYGVWVSYFEIYNEMIFDLLAIDATKAAKGARVQPEREALSMQKNKEGHFVVKGLLEKGVSSAEEAYELLQKGQQNRQVAATVLNRDSSRSHAIFSIKLLHIPKGKGKKSIMDDPSIVKHNRLYIVDLAGCESAKTKGPRLTETKHINTSLMTFGKCIRELRWNQSHPNAPQKAIPWRDSQLTKLVCNFFEGSSGGKAIMITNINPSSEYCKKTSQVLEFSRLATGVSTKEADVPSTPLLKKKKLNAERNGGETATPSETPLTVQKSNTIQLRRELRELKQLLKEQEILRLQMEAEVRLETANEMAQRLQEMEIFYKQRLLDARDAAEEKFERKIQILTKHSFKNINNSFPMRLPSQLPAGSNGSPHTPLSQRNACSASLVSIKEAESLREEIKELSASLEETRANLEAAQNEAMEHKRMVEEYRMQLKANDAERATLLQKMSLQQQMTDAMEQDKEAHVNFWKDKLREEYEDAKLKLATKLQTEIHQLRSELEKERQQSSDLKARVNDLESQLEKIPGTPCKKGGSPIPTIVVTPPKDSAAQNKDRSPASPYYSIYTDITCTETSFGSPSTSHCAGALSCDEEDVFEDIPLEEEEEGRRCNKRKHEDTKQKIETTKNKIKRKMKVRVPLGKDNKAAQEMIKKAKNEKKEIIRKEKETRKEARKKIRMEEEKKKVATKKAEKGPKATIKQRLAGKRKKAVAKQTEEEELQEEEEEPTIPPTPDLSKEKQSHVETNQKALRLVDEEEEEEEETAPKRRHGTGSWVERSADMVQVLMSPKQPMSPLGPIAKNVLKAMENSPERRNSLTRVVESEGKENTPSPPPVAKGLASLSLLFSSV